MTIGSVVVVTLVVPMGPRVEDDDCVPLGAAVPPVLNDPEDDVEFAYGGVEEEADEPPPVPVLKGIDELTPVPVERGPPVPVEIGPRVLVEFEVPLEELDEELGKVKEG